MTGRRPHVAQETARIASQPLNARHPAVRHPERSEGSPADNCAWDTRSTRCNSRRFLPTFIALAASLPAADALALIAGGASPVAQPAPSLMHPPAADPKNVEVPFHLFGGEPALCVAAQSVHAEAPDGCGMYVARFGVELGLALLLAPAAVFFAYRRSSHYPRRQQRSAEAILQTVMQNLLNGTEGDAAIDNLRAKWVWRRLKVALAKARKADFDTLWRVALRATFIRSWVLHNFSRGTQTYIVTAPLEVAIYRAEHQMETATTSGIRDHARVRRDELRLIESALLDTAWTENIFYAEYVDDLLRSVREHVLRPMGFNDFPVSPWDALPERLRLRERAVVPPVAAGDASSTVADIVATAEALGATITSDANAAAAADAPTPSPIDTTNPYCRECRNVGELSARFLHRVSNLPRGRGHRLQPSAVVAREREQLCASPHANDILRRQITVVVEAIKAEHGEPNTLFDAVRLQTTDSKAAFEQWMERAQSDFRDTPLIAVWERTERAYDELSAVQQETIGDAGIFAEQTDATTLDHAAVQTAFEIFYGEASQRHHAGHALRQAANQMMHLGRRVEAQRLRALAAYLDFECGVPNNPETEVQTFVATCEGGSTGAVARWCAELRRRDSLRAVYRATPPRVSAGDGGDPLAALDGAGENHDERAEKLFVGRVAAFFERFAKPSLARAGIIVARIAAQEDVVVPKDFFKDAGGTQALEQRAMATILQLLREDDYNARLAAPDVARAAADALTARGEQRTPVRMQLVSELLRQHVDRSYELSSAVEKYLAAYEEGFPGFAAWLNSLDIVKREGYADVEHSPLAPLIETLRANLPRLSVADRLRAAQETRTAQLGALMTPPSAATSVHGPLVQWIAQQCVAFGMNVIDDDGYAEFCTAVNALDAAPSNAEGLLAVGEALSRNDLRGALTLLRDGHGVTSAEFLLAQIADGGSHE